MKSIFLEGVNKAVVKDLPKPKAEKGELLLKPLTVGLCFTEKHAYEEGHAWIFAGFGLGHEISGEIAEIGPEVEGWELGDRVTVHPVIYCGKCPMCRAGLYMTCHNLGAICMSPRPTGGRYDGAMAEYFVVPDYLCHKVPDAVSDMAAANVEPFSCGTRAVRHSGIAVGDNVLVLGLEDYANSTMQWAKIAGAKQVVVADPYKSRRDVAAKLGADVVLDPNATDLVESVRELMPFGADLVFVSQENYNEPSYKYLAQAIQLARVQGTVGIVRLNSDKLFHGLDFNSFWFKELNIRTFGQFFGEEPWRGGKDRGDYAVTIDAFAKGTLDGESHATNVIDFDDLKTTEDIAAMFASLPEEEAKVMVKIWSK